MASHCSDAHTREQSHETAVTDTGRKLVLHTLEGHPSRVRKGILAVLDTAGLEGTVSQTPCLLKGSAALLGGHLPQLHRVLLPALLGTDSQS